jgi:hypothetical protein
MTETPPDRYPPPPDRIRSIDGFLTHLNELAQWLDQNDLPLSAGVVRKARSLLLHHKNDPD